MLNGFKNSFLDILKGFHPKLFIPVIFGAIYTYLILLLLQELNIWNPNLLKDAIFWFFFGGLYLLFQFGISKKEGLVTAILNNLKVIALIEFILNFYSFSFWIEFILIPIITTITLMDLVGRRKDIASSFLSILQNLLVIFGFSVLAYVGYQIAMNPNSFFTLLTLKKVLLPPILTILFLPFVFLFSLYTVYEEEKARI